MGSIRSKMRTAFFVFSLAHVEAVTKAVYNSAATTTFDSQQQPDQQSTSDSFDAIYDDVSDITSLSDPSSISIASESEMIGDDYFSAGSSYKSVADGDFTGVSYETVSDSGLASISFSDVSDVTDLSSMLIDDEADFSDSFVSASDSGLDSISFSGASDVADMSSGISSMSMDNEADFSDVSYQSASDSALLSDIDNAPYSDYSTPGRAYQSASSYLSVSEEETDMEEQELDDDFDDDDDEEDEEEKDDEEDDEEETEDTEVDGEDEEEEVDTDDDEDDDEEFDEENDDEDDDDDEDDEVEQDNDVEIYRNVDVAVVPEDQNNIYDSRDYSRIEPINDFDDNSFFPRSFNTRNSRPVWTIKDEPLSMFDYDSYETHHWVIIASVIVALLTFLAYYLVFRKNGKLHHLAPSSRSRKKKYEQIDADVYNEDEDTDSYTYDDEYALDNKT